MLCYQEPVGLKIDNKFDTYMPKRKRKFSAKYVDN